MKFITYNWASTAKNLPAWFKHNDEVEVADFWEAMKELYATGNNVMITHGKDNTIVYVDDRRFGQR